MKLFCFDIRREMRASPEDPRVPISDESFLAFLGIESNNLPTITVDRALKVPAVMAAVAFLSRTLAALPLHAYRRSGSGPSRIEGKLEKVIHENPNTEMDSFKFRQYFWQQVFTSGRGLAWVERSGPNVEALWPFDATQTTIRRVGMRLIYRFDGREYPGEDVIDIPFMLRANQTGHYGPINLASKAIQLALAMNDYASGFFAGGGVPPLALTGPLPAGPDAMKRAQQDVRRAVDAAKAKNEAVFPIPAGYKLEPVGFDPAKGQMTEARLYQVQEIARAWQLPPVFLQDLSRGTFANVEQQDLHFVKHLVSQWAQALDGEMNLKLFGRLNNNRYVEHTLDGLMRGDFASRMDGYAKQIQNGIRTPDEVRALENLPAKGGVAEDLYIQGATVPLGSQLKTGGAPANPNGDPSNVQP